MRVVLFWLACTSLALMVVSAERANPRYTVLLAEATIYLGVMIGLVLCPPVRRALSRSTWIHRSIIYSFVALGLVAQLSHSDGVSFPIVSWTMFSSPPLPADKEVQFYEFIGIMEDGKEVVLRPPAIVRPLSHGRIVSKTSALLRQALADEATMEDRRKVDATLRGMMRAYNHQRGGGRLMGIRVVSGRFRLDDYGGERSIDKSEVWRTTL